MVAVGQAVRAVFRADATVAGGAGHVIRCLGLAHEFDRAGWHVAFASREGTSQYAPQLDQAAHELFELSGDAGSEPAHLIGRWPAGAGVLIVDHYERDRQFESACRPWARRILAIDDLAGRLHECDVLLDQAPAGTIPTRAGELAARCLVLRGPRYALLRPEFARLRRKVVPRNGQGPVKRVLIGMGATDPDDASGRVLDGIERSGCAVEVDVVIGSGAPHLSRLRQRVAASALPARLHVDTGEVADLMACADLAIGAAGIASWERCCVGLPALVAVIAGNQEPNARALGDAGAAVLLGKGQDLTAAAVATAVRALCGDQQALSRMSEAAARLCDGRGARRVMLAVLGQETAKDGRPVSLLLAEEQDSEMLFEWQRNPETRRYARNPNPPGPDEHARWFQARLADPISWLTMICHGGEPVGVLRLDPITPITSMKRDKALEVSIHLRSDRHRQGIGAAALTLARRLMPGYDLFAEVMQANEASRHLFERSGYHLLDGWYVDRRAASAGECARCV